jgi:hypothetical protein
MLAQFSNLQGYVASKKQKKEQIKIEADAVTSSGDTASGDSVSTTPQIPEDEQSEKRKRQQPMMGGTGHDLFSFLKLDFTHYHGQDRFYYY